MSERPIIFSAPMGLALLDGRKAQTRRILKPQPEVLHCASEHLEDLELRGFEAFEQPSGLYLVCRPPWAPGDRLWVREAWRATEEWDKHPPRAIQPGYVRYEADPCTSHSYGKLRPSIFMPRWASRLTLVVTEVRVERLQDISEADAVAEGIAPFGASGAYLTPKHRDGKMRPGISAYDLFRDLWNNIHGADAWAANPWVAAISFAVNRANIDALDLGAAA